MVIPSFCCVPKMLFGKNQDFTASSTSKIMSSNVVWRFVGDPPRSQPAVKMTFLIELTASSPLKIHGKVGHDGHVPFALISDLSLEG